MDISFMLIIMTVSTGSMSFSSFKHRRILSVFIFALLFPRIQKLHHKASERDYISKCIIGLGGSTIDNSLKRSPLLKPSPIYVELKLSSSLSIASCFLRPSQTGDKYSLSAIVLLTMSPTEFGVGKIEHQSSAQPFTGPI